MPKSKTRLKRRKTIKKRVKAQRAPQRDNEFDNDYMKTDGTGRVMVMNKHHTFIRWATEEETTNF